jgi:hypothetical protein
MRSLALFALLTTLTPWAAAQRVAHTAHPAISRSHSPNGHLAFASNAHPSGFRRSSPLTSLPFPFFGDSFNPEDIYSTGYPVASELPPFLLQAARAMPGAPDSLAQPELTRPRTDPSQPLMIELQHGHYVRVATTPADGDALPLTLTSSTSAVPAHDLPPAILIFRDGRTEEVRDYTIADGILYARGDYYTDGYWNKKIDLSSLNVAETLQANVKQSIKFILPSSPNEVITRP